VGRKPGDASHRDVYDGTFRPPIGGAHHQSLAGAPRAVDEPCSRVGPRIVENDSQARMAQFQSAEQRQNSQRKSVSRPAQGGVLEQRPLVPPRTTLSPEPSKGAPPALLGPPHSHGLEPP